MKTYPCPYCGQTYRHPGMAERCMKKPLCRALNAPNGRIRREWEIQAGTLTIALFIASARAPRAGRSRRAGERGARTFRLSRQ